MSHPLLSVEGNKNKKSRIINRGGISFLKTSSAEFPPDIVTMLLPRILYCGYTMFSFYFTSCYSGISLASCINYFICLINIANMEFWRKACLCRVGEKDCFAKLRRGSQKKTTKGWTYVQTGSTLTT